MNGGTNIALSIKQAGQLLKGEDADAARIIVLLTDGRVDAFQGQHLHITCQDADLQALCLSCCWCWAGLQRCFCGCMAGRVEI